MNWKTLYKCTCGEIITNGVGKWDDMFFLSEVCPKCGASKYKFKKLGVGYWKAEPSLLNWFKGRWIMREQTHE